MPQSDKKFKYFFYFSPFYRYYQALWKGNGFLLIGHYCIDRLILMTEMLALKELEELLQDKCSLAEGESIPVMSKAILRITYHIWQPHSMILRTIYKPGP
jgi:hypothetical protein